MTDPLVIRINHFMTEDDFKYVSRKLKQDNPNIIVLPPYCEVLHPQIIRCKECKYWSCDDDESFCSELGIFNTDKESYCSYAKRKEE